MEKGNDERTRHATPLPNLHVIQPNPQQNLDGLNIIGLINLVLVIGIIGGRDFTILLIT